MACTNLICINLNLKLSGRRLLNASTGALTESSANFCVFKEMEIQEVIQITSLSEHSEI